MKKTVFWIVTILFPFILLGLAELLLQAGGYNESSQELFIEVPSQPEYLTTNADFVARYFPSFQPKVGPYPFLKEKTENVFRVFVLGGSSAEGFPYNFYHSFASQLEQKLVLETQDLNIEVINLGMTAVNSYVIWDLSSRLIDYDPDAIIIYAGHNEYYGSFGVGSTQFGLGGGIILKRLRLKLKDWRLYQLIEDLLRPEDSEEPDNRTMMASVVKDAGIELNSELYDAGIRQFEKNIGDVVEHLNRKDIPVYIGTIASNLKDQPPLSEDAEAIELFREGERLFREGNTEASFEKFNQSKEKDVIRFRASDEINKVIREFSAKDGVQLVEVEQMLRDSSESGIEDESLFIDHLHPNVKGHRLIADLLFKKLMSHEGKVNEYYLANVFQTPEGISEFEKTYADITIQRLLVGYPFQKGLSSREEARQFQNIYQDYLNAGFTDSLAAATKVNLKSVPSALNRVINQKKKSGDSVSAMSHYYELLHWQLNSGNLIDEIIAYAVNNPNVESHLVNVIEKVLNEGSYDPRYMNVLSSVYINNQAYEEAKYWLDESLRLKSEEPALFYNLTRYYLFKKDTARAGEYYNKFLQAR